MRKLIVSTVMAIAGLGATAGGAAAAVITSLNSDGEFLADDFTKLGGGNVRWGNGAGNGDWEYAVVNSGDTPIGTGSLQHDWGPGDNAHSGTLSNGGNDVIFRYSAAGLATLAPDLDSGAASGDIGGGADVIYIRARANADDGQVASLFNIALIFHATNVVLSLGDLIGDNDAEYIRVESDQLAQGFDLAFSRGANINGGSNPQGSSPMWQVKVGTTDVPAPAGAVLLLAGLAGVAAARRKRI